MRLHRKCEKSCEVTHAILSWGDNHDNKQHEIIDTSRKYSEASDKNIDELNNQNNETEIGKQNQVEISHQHPAEIKTMEAFKTDQHHKKCSAGYCNDEEESGEACDGNESESYEGDHPELTGSTKNVEPETNKSCVFG